MQVMITRPFFLILAAIAEADNPEGVGESLL